MGNKNAITMRYTNYRGEQSIRKIIPSDVPQFLATEHHLEPQWIMRAWDIDKGAYRDFALRDCDFTIAALPAAPMGVGELIDKRQAVSAIDKTFLAATGDNSFDQGACMAYSNARLAIVELPAPTLGDAWGLDTPPSESDNIATMISDLSHTGDLSMLYRMEIADALTSLSAALGSIARNTCCEGCQEAALVALAALKGGE